MSSFSLSFFFHGKALGGADVFEIDAAVGGGDHLDRLHDVVFALPRKDDGDGVDARELAEQDRLALHDGQARKPADVAQTEHGAAVEHDGDGVPFAGIGIGGGRILRDLAAGLRHAGGVSEGKSFPVLYFHEGAHLVFAAQLRVQFQRLFVYVHKNSAPFVRQVC